MVDVIRRHFDPSFPTEIAPNVWVGDQRVAKDLGFFLKHGIKRVVNCTPDVPFYFKWCRYMRIAVGDSRAKTQNEVMTKAIPDAVTFMLEPLPSKNDAVFIHCHVGVSRSCTVAAALVRVCCAKTIDQALSFVVAKRPVAFFNGQSVNFRQALVNVFKK